MANEVTVSTTNQLKKWFSNESLIKQLGSQLSISPQAFTSSEKKYPKIATVNICPKTDVSGILGVCAHLF